MSRNNPHTMLGSISQILPTSDLELLKSVDGLHRNEAQDAQSRDLSWQRFQAHGVDSWKTNQSRNLTGLTRSEQVSCLERTRFLRSTLDAVEDKPVVVKLS